ncbi:hypothetical protein M8C21_012358 [Ambrosia artemisiifolia]|uniref:Uncharacterized protein n=1 Tax=Ambrosia artemisiifolia TaxID=4212 RepID=A0AAD5CI77_AMBAR|nr:hypothetical protein M8C21_012358 [Ambrosia artemisiifolia]
MLASSKKGLVNGGCRWSWFHEGDNNLGWFQLEVLDCRRKAVTVKEDEGLDDGDRVRWMTCFAELRPGKLACMKLGSKADAFQKQGQTWSLMQVEIYKKRFQTQVLLAKEGVEKGKVRQIRIGTIWKHLVVDAKIYGCFYNVREDINLV